MSRINYIVVVNAVGIVGCLGALHIDNLQLLANTESGFKNILFVIAGILGELVVRICLPAVHIAEQIVTVLRVRSGIGRIAGIGRIGRSGRSGNIEVAAEVRPIALVGFLEIDGNGAGMSRVYCVVVVSAVGIPCGNSVVLYLDNLDGVTFGQSSVKIILAFRRFVRGELVSSGQVRNCPAVDADKIEAVLKVGLYRLSSGRGCSGRVGSRSSSADLVLAVISIAILKNLLVGDVIVSTFSCFHIYSLLIKLEGVIPCAGRNAVSGGMNYKEILSDRSSRIIQNRESAAVVIPRVHNPSAARSCGSIGEINSNLIVLRFAGLRGTGRLLRLGISAIESSVYVAVLKDIRSILSSSVSVVATAVIPRIAGMNGKSGSSSRNSRFEHSECLCLVVPEIITDTDTCCRVQRGKACIGSSNVAAPIMKLVCIGVLIIKITDNADIHCLSILRSRYGYAQCREA